MYGGVRHRSAGCLERSLNQQTGTPARWLDPARPAFVAAIAYVDPGNVAANISAGSQFGFLLVG